MIPIFILMKLIFITSLLVVFLIGCIQPSSTQSVKSQDISFFITSKGPGDGANLGGLEGADAHCRKLAEEAGLTDKTWKAYLSTTGEGSVNARDRIGLGPWYNFNGVKIAEDVEELHSDNNLNKETGLSEKGEVINGRGDSPNRHDILTGSQMDGSAFVGSEDTTCNNWKSNSEGSAYVGHHDRMGLRDDEPSKSWSSSHPSRGCSQSDLQGTGGDGLFYCFAT
jgi:hypothetical protein